MDDAELLQRYAAERSEAAFAEIVRRHVDLVYAAALRQMRGDHHRAQEVTQMVFVSLAKKAAALVRHPALPAWLYRSTGLAALDLQRREARRRFHEREAAIEATLYREADAMPEWDRIRPVLDDAISQLGERDREAIVLRYFANRSYTEIGGRLGLSENAARMRVDRAVDKLRERLGSRGITSTCAALAVGLAAEASIAAPAGVAAGALAAAGAAGSAAAGSAILLFMSANKITAGAIALFITAGAATVTMQERANARLATEVSNLQAQASDLDALSRENQALTRSAKEARDLQLAAQAGDRFIARFEALSAEVAGMRRQIANRRQAAAPPAQALPDAVSGETVDVSKLSVPPHPVSQSRPQYPFDMRRAGISGSVTVDFIVSVSGDVVNARAVSSSRPEFEASAVQAVSSWVFRPGTLSGHLVNTHMQVPIVFTLNHDPAAGNATVFEATAPSAPTDWFPGS